MPDATLTQPSNAAPPAPPAGKPKKPASKKQMRRIAIASVTAAALAVGGYFLYRFLTKNDSAGAEMQTVVADYGSIQSKASGSGNAKAKENAAITLSAGGTVREVFVAAGDTVTAGQPLYTIYSQSAQDEVSTAQEQLDGLNKDMKALLEDANNLTVRAPFAGKLLSVKDFDPDQDITKGETVATLVNDKKLKLSLYFSYAHEGQIRTGQSVNVSIPSVMANLTGTVETIHKVNYISPEGAVHFEAVIVFDNPGTLTAGMEASASLTASDGTAIYPYQNGKTEYYETREIVTKAAGPLVSKGNLHDYANVSAGEALLTMGSDTIDLDIRSKQKELDDAQTKLADAQKALANFNAVSPIDGTVTSMNLQVGQEVKSGDTAVMISNNTTMLVDITVDAFLPEEYIPDAAGRIEAYKRIAAIETTSDAEDVLDELIDRYGSPPKSVQGLVDVSLVRVTAARVGIAEIVQRGDQLILYSDIVGPKQLGEVMEKFPHRVLYNALGRPYFSLRVQKGESPLVLLRDVVTLLPGAQNQP